MFMVSILTTTFPPRPLSSLIQHRSCHQFTAQHYQQLSKWRCHYRNLHVNLGLAAKVFLRTNDGILSCVPIKGFSCCCRSTFAAVLTPYAIGKPPCIFAFCSTAKGL